MGSIRQADSIAKLIKTSSTQASLGLSIISIGAFQYRTTSNLVLTTSVSGIGGIDTGTISAGQLYYAYAVVSSGSVYLIFSLSSTGPLGYSAYKVVGGFTTNASSQIDQVGEYPGNLAVAGSVSAGGGVAAQDTRNYIINGGFDFWQRGASLSAASSRRYLADRFSTDASTSTIAASKQDLATGSFSDQVTRYFHRCVVASSPSVSAYAVLTHMIENVYLLAGKTVTLSFWAKADTNKNIAVEVSRSYGSGGSASDILAPKTLSLTTAWAKYNLVYNIPSLSGKTVGTGTDHSVNLNLWFDAGSNYNARTNSLGQQSGTFDFAEFMLNIGTAAALFQRAGGTIGGELALCSRYYHMIPNASGNSNDGAIIATGYYDNTNNFVGAYYLPVPMRVAPAIITQNVANALEHAYFDAVATAVNANVVSSSYGHFNSPNRVLILASGATKSGGVGGHLRYANGADITPACIGLDAEL